MDSIGRYIFRTTFGAFAMVLVSLTGLIWVTHALREFDLMTNQGQTILVFIGVTGLFIPMLVLIIAPVALVIAVGYVLNKLNTDSEIIVMNAAGMSPFVVFRAFLAVAMVVSILVAVISAYLSPKGLRELRNWASQIRAELVTNILQPGRFMPIEAGLTFFVRERRPNGQLQGIVVDDRRNPKERITSLAERGEILDNESGTFLILEAGSIQRENADRDPTIVLFERYGIDLSQFNSSSQIRRIGPRERYLWELAAIDQNDPQFKGQHSALRAEFHDRVLAPIYPIVFVVIAFAFLGAPSTTRQSRATAIGMAIGSIALLRLFGFATIVMAVRNPSALIPLYLALAGAFSFGLYAISRGVVIEPPATLTRAIARLSELFSRAPKPALSGQP